MLAVAVRLRRLLVRRPWIYWMAVCVIALGVGVRVYGHLVAVGAARESWGDTVEVQVAIADIAPGDPIVAERREVPAAMVPDQPADDVDGSVARQHVSVGEIVTAVDVVASTGPLALTPAGWLAVPVIESPTSGALVGDRVQVASDGIVLSSEATVVGHSGDATLVAVPAVDAPLLPAADRVTLLLVP